MTAALKMAAPGEQCAQTQRLIDFCTIQSRSIKEIKRHLAVTEERAHQLLNGALASNRVSRGSGGKYFARSLDCETQLLGVLSGHGAAVSMGVILASMTGFAPETVKAELDKLVAADHVRFYSEPGSYYLLRSGKTHFAQISSTNPAEKAPYKPESDALLKLEEAHGEPAETESAVDTVEIDTALNELVEQGLVKVEGDTLQVNEPACKNALLDAELTSLAEQLDPDQFPVIDDIDTKQHALAGIALLLKARTPLLANITEQLATDLSVIRLHQERRA